MSPTERFVICHNPDAALRDAHMRDQLVAQLDELIAGSDTLPVMKRGELRGRISTKPGLNRYLRVTPGGLLRIDKAKIKAEANLDGKYLLRCSDPHLPATDIALGYKQLLEVERGWRDMKQILDLRPVYHRLEERIRAHRQATLDRAHAQHPERFTRRPSPPRLPEQAWINQPALQPAQ